MPKPDQDESRRLGLLLGRSVVDADGVRIGRVHDIRLRRDGPIIPGFGPALRLEGLIVGPTSLARRFGLGRPDVTGPWPLDVWGRRAARRAKVVPWERVELREGVVHCSERLHDMQSAYE
jgi:hypothetical protein